MKARLTYENLPPQYKKDIQRIVAEFERRYRDAIIERFISAMLLTARDVFGFGYKRMNLLLRGFSEILQGYNEDAYYGVDPSVQNMEMMNKKMREELEAGGIIISQNQGNISIKTLDRKNRSHGGS